MNLVGPEATQRLESLDGQRRDWKNKVDGYLKERDNIMKSGMSEDAKQKAVQQLRTQHFNKPEEQLRVGTFESVHDQGGKLPYGE
jgi:lipase chaperone LimK